MLFIKEKGLINSGVLLLGMAKSIFYQQRILFAIPTNQRFLGSL